MSEQPTTSQPEQQPGANAPAKKQPTTVKEFLALPAYRGRFDEVLSKRAPQFMASITNYVAMSPQVADCDPKSVIAAAFVAATLDLPIDKNLGMAWIVPYNTRRKGPGGEWLTVKVAQFQLGARGVTQLALRSGQYERLNAKAINAEAFGGFDKDVGEPIIFWEKVDDAKPVVGYAVAWRLTNGFTKTAYWTKEKVTNHAARYSQAYRSRKPGQPWNDHFDAMALKTVAMNELRKWGVLSVQMQTAMQHDQGSQDDIDAPVKHDDGTGLFDVESTESLGSVLGDTPPADGAQSDGKAVSRDSGKATSQQPAAETTGPAYTEAEFKAALTLLENHALNLSLSEHKLIEQAKALNQVVPKDAKKLGQLPYATLLKLVEWAKQYAAGNA